MTISTSDAWNEGRGLRALIGVGGNIGTGAIIAARFAAAGHALRDHLTRALAVKRETVALRWSPCYWSAPEGPVRDQPRFLNAVLEVQAGVPMAPDALLSALLDIETRLGRIRPTPVVQGPRTIDLDLLFVADLCADTPGPPPLTLPHPQVVHRAFVLKPLADLVGTAWRMPGFARTVGECLQERAVFEQLRTLARATEARPMAGDLSQSARRSRRR